MKLSCFNFIVLFISNLRRLIMKYVNLTPHSIVLNDGRTFEPSGIIARVQATHSEFKDDLCSQVFGAVDGLPDQQEDTRYIVSAMILSATNRSDVVAPATGHPMTIRNEKGHIVSVPGFIQK